MLTNSLLVILSVASLSSSHLDDSAIRNELKKIRIIEDDDKRLLAYDTLAGSIDQDGPPQNVVGTGKWFLESSTDRMTDEVTPYIYLKSSSPLKDWLGQDMTMVLQVQANKWGGLTLYIKELGGRTAFEISFSETSPFTFRVDKKPPMTLQLKVEDDVARLSRDLTRSFIQQICEGRELLIRFDGFDGDKKYASFDTRGLSNALVHFESHSVFKNLWTTAEGYLK